MPDVRATSTRFIGRRSSRIPRAGWRTTTSAISWPSAGEIDAAMELFGKALKLNPDYPEAHNDLGIVLVQQGRIDEGIAHFREAIRLNPEYRRMAHYNLGRALAMQGRVDEAHGRNPGGPETGPQLRRRASMAAHRSIAEGQDAGRLGRAARIAPLEPQ